ncbi:MAG: LamG-like jellyroll fold domain-containing protein [Planctomycetota bacterium]
MVSQRLRTQLRAPDPGARAGGPSGRCRGMSLIEILVVLAILTMILGLSVSAYQRLGRGYVLPAAASQVSSVIRAARNFSVSAGVPSKVFVDSSPEQPQIAAFGFKLVANWHFEDAGSEETEDRPIEPGAVLRGGRGDGASVVGRVFAAPGKVGRALYFEDGGAAVADHKVRYHSVGGMSLEAWIRFLPRDERPEALYAVISKPGSYEVGVTGDQAVYLSLWGAWGGRQDDEYLARSVGGVVIVDRWTHVRATWDGLELQLEVDGIRHGLCPVGYERIAEEEWPAPPARISGPDSYLSVSRPDRFFMGFIDEVKVRAALEPRVFELPSGVQFLGPSQTIYFDARGSLDPLRHREAVVVRMTDDTALIRAESAAGGTVAVPADPVSDDGDETEGEDAIPANPLAALARYLAEERERVRQAEGAENEDEDGEPKPGRPAYQEMAAPETIREILVDLTGTIRG